MIEIPDYNALFLHVPKTGGTWVRQVLDRSNVAWRYPGCDRLPYNGEFRHALPMHWSQRPAIRFCFVRNPVDWYVSLWRWCNPREKERALRWNWHPCKELIALWCEDFEVWVTTCLDRYPAFYTRMLWLYAGPPGGDFVSVVGRQETLAQDLSRIGDDMGVKLDVSVPPAHVSQATKVYPSRYACSGINRLERAVLERWY